MAKTKVFQVAFLVIVLALFFTFLYYSGFFRPVKVVVDDGAATEDAIGASGINKGIITEKAINRYLVDELAFETLKNTVIFCSHDILGKEEGKIYVFADCAEFIAGDRTLRPQSEFSSPLVFLFDGDEISGHQKPGDDSFEQDMKDLFPEAIQRTVAEYSSVNLAQKNIFKAREFFGYDDNYEIIEQIKKTCSEHFDCVTPSDYLLRSDCPYESRCINQVCTVVCPAVEEVDVDKDSTSTEGVVGGDRDEHGCIGSAGYTWCEAKQKCLRAWEEDCPDIVINSFEDCLEAGYPLMESFPRQCAVPGGETFVEEIEQ